MQILMFNQVLSAAGLASHSLTAASYSPDALKKYMAMSLRSLRFDWIPALSSCLMAFSTRLKYTRGTSLVSHSESCSEMSFFSVSEI